MVDREYGRHDRVAALLRRELAQMIQQDVKDPRVGSVTVTDVEVTSDLSLARVYIASVDSATLPESIKALTRAGGFLRRKLGHALTLRMVPELRFLADDSAQRGDHIDALLKSVIPEGTADDGDEATSEYDDQTSPSDHSDPQG
ncbi:MAG: 30S ribosome-binding factor RbfA [Lysobacterales bacterium]